MYIYTKIKNTIFPKIFRCLNEIFYSRRFRKDIDIFVGKNVFLIFV